MRIGESCPRKRFQDSSGNGIYSKRLTKPLGGLVIEHLISHKNVINSSKGIIENVG